jgi:uncharacterized protein with HEPN domain
MRHEDIIRLQHMLDAARDAVGFAQGRERKSLDSDRQLVMAIVKCVEIIGEAATKISQDTQAKISNLPWLDMINMRHRLVHTYYDINLDVVWTTIQEDLPTLIKALQTIPDLK